MYHDPPKDGGLWLKTLCGPCNGLAGKYDDAYGDFARRVMRTGRLTRAAFVLPETSTAVPPVAVAPGRVARSVLHGMVALAPTMHLHHEQFLRELRRDGEVNMPLGLELRVARVRGPECRLSSAYWMQQVMGEVRQNYDVLAEICFFPFIWALRSRPPRSLGPSMIDTEGWGDATDWIRYDRSAVRSDLRDVLDRFPTTLHPTQRDRGNWIEAGAGAASNVLEGFISNPDSLLRNG